MSASIDSDFPPFPLGAPRSPLALDPRPDHPPQPVADHVCLDYPSRINAMALDSSKIVPSRGAYLAGELLFACDLMRRVEVEIVGDGPAVQTAPDCDHPVLARHAALLMRTALGTRERLRVRVSAPDLPAHLGLGSSSGQIAAVAAAVNELYGHPVPARRLVKFLALNHGEEIDHDDAHLLPVQCLGGSATAGLIPGAVQVIAGAHVPLLQAALPEDMRIVLGMPHNPVIWDARDSLAAEARHFDAFTATGRTYGPEIAYRLLHDAWPALLDGELGPLGSLLFDYRFRMGSLANCAFSHPELLATGEKVEHIFTERLAEVLTLSSVGPTFAALTRTPERCEQAFADAGLRTVRCRPWNSGYTLHGQEEQ
ncbi:GHMP family kinase ATP-binding protein [Streptomyces sp. SGAir0957]